MLYAKVVLGIPVEGPFDYIVPANICRKIKAGMRAWVSFRNQRLLGYVVKLTKETKIKNLKTLLEVIDDFPVLDKNILLLTKKLSDYYCCSWGEAIETALPEGLRKGKRIPKIKEPKYNGNKNNPEVTLIQDLDGKARWDIYFKSIKETLDNNRSVIVLLSDINYILRARETINARLGIQPVLLYRKEPKEVEEWLKVKEGKFNIVVGTRSSIFAPMNNLGLVIIDEEQDAVYKQDQVPHYHAREVAFMRIGIEKAKLILASASPSLESLYLAREKKINPSTTLKADAEQSRSIKYILIPPKSFPEIKIVDTHDQYYNFKKESILSKYLEDLINLSLNSSGKILLFLNRKGFATFVSCRYCSQALRCPRCNINLVYYFKDNILNCHYCNFKMPPPKICPNCNSGYIRYSGVGTEKIESELSRIFAQARIQRLDTLEKIDINDADIFISTKSIIRGIDYTFDLVVVLDIDNSLSRIDFRSSEKTFALLVGLLGLAKGKVIIQTRFPQHRCFQALVKKDINAFYDEELKERRELQFPPFKHLGVVKLRGEKESRTREASEVLFKRLNNYNKNKTVKIMSVNPAYPSKLRGKFSWQILIKASSASVIVKFLKKYLKDFSHSGIIVTVDMDPL